MSNLVRLKARLVLIEVKFHESCGVDGMDSRNRPLATMAKTLLRDEEGFVVTIELILIATIVGIGSIVGLTTLRNAINSELADVSDAIESMDWGDEEDAAPSSTSAANSCISYSVPPSDEA